MLKAYKYRIYPTEQQEVLINKTFDCWRFVYHTCIYLGRWVWKTEHTIGAFEFIKQFADTKEIAPWLSEPGSQKALRVVPVHHERIKNQRRDFLHKLSTHLVHENQAPTLVLENLSVKNMVKNHHLAGSITDGGWGEFVSQLQYKCDRYRKKLIRIGTFEPSSKTCSTCGHVLDELDLSVREWTCPKCSVTHDRDINAANNIRIMGLKTGAGSSEVPVEQRRIRRAMNRESIQTPSCI